MWSDSAMPAGITTGAATTVWHTGASGSQCCQCNVVPSTASLLSTSKVFKQLAFLKFSSFKNAWFDVLWTDVHSWVTTIILYFLHSVLHAFRSYYRSTQGHFVCRWARILDNVAGSAQGLGSGVYFTYSNALIGFLVIFWGKPLIKNQPSWNKQSKNEWSFH